MLSLISEPIVIPSSNIIVDKTTMEQHLIHKQTNPFTNEPLTMQMIQEYNELPKQQETINEFLQKLHQWKDNSS